MTDKIEEQAETEAVATIEGGPLAVVEDHDPKRVLIDPDARTKMMDYAEKLVAEHVPDVSTDAGRVAIRKLASTITRTKTAITQAAKELTEEWRAKTAAVNDQRKPLEESLTLLAKKARAPLTEWEEAEDKRLAIVETTLQKLVRDGVVAIDETIETVEQRLAAVRDVQLDPAIFQATYDAAIKARDHSVELLTNAVARLRKEEADRKELEELRRQAAAREERDRQLVEQERAKARQAELEAEREEQARVAEAERKEREAREAAAAEEAAAAAAKREREAAERAATEAREAAEREAQAERDRLQREADEAQAERDRQHAEELRIERERVAEAERKEKERKEKEEREAAERARLEADQARRQAAKREAKEALMTFGVDEETAKKIVIGIIAREIPRVTLDFAADPHPKSAREAFDEGRHEGHLEDEDAPLLQKVQP